MCVGIEKSTAGAAAKTFNVPSIARYTGSQERSGQPLVKTGVKRTQCKPTKFESFALF